MTDAQLINRYKEGQFIAEIAAEAGQHSVRIMERLRELRRQGRLQTKRRGNPQFKRTTRQAIVRRDLVKRLRTEGLTNAEIAEELEISQIRVSQIVSELIDAGQLERRINRFK